ncbi:hypothetical protein MTR67_032259 [Solanum verrucosum]|uniref:Protein kinase domain-containing protein n=1 Tax=Solanum verrucosum TaxID=315347 RepID=A0AAF0U448_SOLVR|nr:hypothetical protein MTR67_032259 [Solanum verrucosum]
MGSKDTIETVEKQRNHPLHLHQSDTPGSLLTSIQLTGVENYAVWSRSMILTLRAKSKLGFVYGTCKKSDYGDDLEEQWEKCNAFVLYWILNSVSKELMSGIIYATDASVVWSDLKERFDKVDGSRGYQLHREICTIAQGNSSVSAYFTKLRVLWDEFDALVPPPSCGCDKSKVYASHLQYMRLFAFLMGLNESYNQQRSQILMMIPLPSLNKAYSMIVADEGQRITAGSYSGIELGESSSAALYVGSNSSNKPSYQGNFHEGNTSLGINNSGYSLTGNNSSNAMGYNFQVQFDEDEHFLVGPGIHTDTSSISSDLIPDGETSEPTVETSVVDEMNLDHTSTADVATSAPRRSTRATTTPTWHQDYHTGHKVGKQYTPAVDIWSIGCLFAKMLTGKPLFPGKNVVHQLDLMTDLLEHLLLKPLQSYSCFTKEILLNWQIRNEKARRYLGNMRKKPPVPVAQKFPHADPLALRLLECMFAFDPKDRPSAEEALADPYFRSLSNVDREPSTHPISKLEFEFEQGKLAKDVRELIYREIQQALIQKAFREAGLIFAKQGIAITQENSLLNNTVRIEGLLAGFPMFDWVGKRTSGMSAVGLLPAALQNETQGIISSCLTTFVSHYATYIFSLRGIDIREMLAGAALMDEANRTTVDMVVLPYKDSLLLFSRYLQYLVMESPVKEFDLDVLRDRPPGHDWELEPGVTFGDYLFGMLQVSSSSNILV